LVQCESGGEVYFEIREVYYNNTGNVTAMTEDAIGVGGYSVEEILVTLERMKVACSKEVIIEKDFVYDKWDDEFEDGDDDQDSNVSDSNS
jgi:hypothetical protein